MIIMADVCILPCFADEKSSNVIAYIGKESITQQDLDELTRNVPEPFRKAFAQKALERLIDTYVFSKIAKEKGIDKKSEFIARLEKEKARILAEYFIEKNVQVPQPVSSEEIQKYYEQHADMFQTKDKIKASQLVFKDQKEADQVKKKLDAGESFQSLLKNKETIQASPKSGDLGWIEKGKMPKAFDEVVFQLKKGEISPIVQTALGFHIVLVEDKAMASKKTLQEVEAQIRSRISSEKQAQLKKSYIEKAQVRIVDETYQKKETNNPFIFPGQSHK